MRGERGFSLIEVVLAILLMTAGLVALAGALIVGVTLPKRARQQEIAKQLANTVMESIIAAKEALPPGFSTFEQLTYTDTIPSGRFIKDEMLMLEPGPDGVFGTCDDGRTGAFDPVCPSNPGTLTMKVDIDPGPDGVYSNTSDNNTTQLLGFTYKVIIQDLSPSTKLVDVEVYYQTPLSNREIVKLSCQLSNFKKL
jgi:type II secretory pathway pseudopilin PulG